ncbi:hypothetical protein HPS57_07540 [Prevotella sp. PINT]|jgi:hypothetical protein|uniref:hypothetical protein n=1 Tax=Palleniella intestinalis TaxID=2736291 RepID=UPI0015545046|nr:hypothetical protein [Palleniella intestinalis]NPD81826.1 hypothetical protein [Palleniella intestinalis]
MKHFFRFLLLAVAVMACSVETKAQDNDKQRMTPEERVERKKRAMNASARGEAANKDKQKRVAMTREQLAEKQAKHIAEAMAMDDATANRFVKTYGECQKEVWALSPKRGKGMRRNAPGMTDAEAEQSLKADFDHSQKILDIRKKYYKEYSKFLTQKQIKRVYELEKQTKNRLMHHKGKAQRNKAGRNAGR